MTTEKYPSRWIKNGKDWESDERLDGTPDFVITRHQVREPGWPPRTQWRLKTRTSAKGTWFDSATEAKDYVENIAWAHR